jgi:hypothetical protein
MDPDGSCCQYSVISFGKGGIKIQTCLTIDFKRRLLSKGLSGTKEWTLTRSLKLETGHTDQK